MHDSVTDNGKPLYPIQKPWHVGVLTCLSFGVYLFFFLYVYARDLKRLGRNVTPWLYLFPPLVAVALPFATSRLTAGYAEVGKAHGVAMPDRGALLGGLAFVVFVALAAVERLAYDVVGITWLIALPAIGVAFALVTADINQAKRALPEDRFRRPAEKLTPGGWAWMGVGVLLVLPLIGLTAFFELQHLSREKLAAGQPWFDPERRFSVVSQSDWAIAEKGAFSDGYSEAEFSLSDTVYAVVYDQTTNVGSHELSEVRRQEFVEANPAGACQEQRWLVPGSLTRRGQLICHGEWLGDAVVLVSTTIHDGERHIEVISEAQVPSAKRSDAQEALQEFAAGVRLETPQLDLSS